MVQYSKSRTGSWRMDVILRVAVAQSSIGKNELINTDGTPSYWIEGGKVRSTIRSS